MNASCDIRRLTAAGVARFRSYLEALRSGAVMERPDDLLTDPETSEPAGFQKSVEPLTFASALDFAAAADELFREAAFEGLESDVGLWSWMSLYYFDQVCPKDAEGHRKPGRDYRHILEPGFRSGHRHLLGGAYLVYSVYGLGPDLSALFLYTPLSKESRLHHELLARQSLIQNRSVVEAAHHLYFNPKTRRPKRGTLLRKQNPGTFHRFIHVIQQLDVTYDLFSMSGKEILKLLPREFDSWKGQEPLFR